MTEEREPASIPRIAIRGRKDRVLLYRQVCWRHGLVLHESAMRLRFPFVQFRVAIRADLPPDEAVRIARFIKRTPKLRRMGHLADVLQRYGGRSIGPRRAGAYWAIWYSQNAHPRARSEAAAVPDRKP